jgi:inositol oxygenase
MMIILFGFGRAGKIHYSNLLHHQSAFTLTHIVDMVDITEHLAPSVEYVNTEDAEKIDSLMQDESVRAVIVASPTRTHYDLTMLALKHKKHVFVEKPLCEDLTEINNCFDLAKQQDVILAVGYNRRYDPMIASIKSRVDNGAIGKVNYATTTSRDYPLPELRFLDVCGGIFHDCATHDIDYLNWILKDKPLSVYVVTENNAAAACNLNYHHVMINFFYSLGTIAVLNLSRISSSYDQRCEFYGDDGEILNTHYDPEAKISFPERYDAAFKNEIAAFYDSIENQTPCLVTREEVLANYLIAEACEESVRKQRKVTIQYGVNGSGYRDYSMAAENVSQCYKTARTRQTVDFVEKMVHKFSGFDTKIGIWDMMEDLNSLVDVSDPDCSHPNLYHAVQTAEMMRKDGLPEWMQLMGLLHDIGKIMYKQGSNDEGTGEKSQWAMVGDTFIVGCRLPEGLIYPEFNELNPDMSNPSYNTKCGMYSEACGLDNTQCSWGHDEYLYRILSSNKNPHNLPDEALYVARFHSLYAYHDKQEYRHFQSSKDKEMFETLKLFNKYDLYSKTDDIYDVEQLKPYYMGLIRQFFTNDYLYI